MTKKLLPSAFVLASGLAAAGSAHALTATSTLDVTAIVGMVCTVSTSPVVFNVTDQAATTYASGSVTVTCNPGMLFSIDLDAGLNFNGIYRGVTNGPNRLDYDLGSNKYMQPWGDNGLTYPAPNISSTATGGADLFSVDGILFGGHPIVPDGTYTDVVGVTVTY